MSTIWAATVASVGTDALDMIDGGVFILFGSPCPPALAEVAIVHDGYDGQFQPIAPGDRIWIGSQSADITEVGEIANDNLRELGHIVIYLDAGEADLLPGAAKASGTLPAPSPGEPIRFERVNHA